MNQAQVLWKKLVTPRAAGEAEARREYMTRVILALTGISLVVFMVPVLAGYRAQIFDRDALVTVLLIGCLMAVSWWLTVRGRWRAARYIPPLTFLWVGALGSYQNGLWTTQVLAYAVAILLANMLLGVRAQWLMVGLSAALHLGLGQGLHPKPMDDFISSVVVVSASLIGLALLQAFASSLLQDALAEAQAQNTRLRTANAEHRKTALELQASEARFRAYVEESPVAIFVAEASGRYVDVNLAASALSGYGRAELLQLTMFDLVPALEVEKLRARLAVGDGAIAGEAMLRRKDGSVLTILRHRVRLPDGDLLSFCTDITGRRQAEEQVRRLNAELEERVTARTAELSRLNVELQREVAERQRAEGVLRASVDEKEVLLKEIHHRVKNNLQVISSLLMLQGKQLRGNPEAAAALHDSQQRVRSMALIHEKLYRANSLAGVNLADYIHHLATSIVRSYEGSSAVDLRLQLEAVALGLDQAVPCGLILNELVTNALKYAFPAGRHGILWIDVRAVQGGRVLLRVADDGPGLPPDLDIYRTSSLGMQLVINLAAQLRGTVQVARANGADVQVEFPLAEETGAHWSGDPNLVGGE